MSTTKVPAGMLIRLRSGVKPLDLAWIGGGRHAARSTVDYGQGVGTRDPGDYVGRHREGVNVGLTQLRISLRDLRDLVAVSA